MATERGLVKKTNLGAYGNIRAGGIIGIAIEEGDRLIGVRLTEGRNEVMLITRKGMSIRFSEAQLRDQGRATIGVKGIALGAGDRVESIVIAEPNATLLVVTENGYGKRTAFDEYRRQSRGGKGIITIKTNDRNGAVVAVKEVVDGDELMIVTRQGQLIRMPVKGISVMGRNTQGVRLVNLAVAGESELLADTVAGVTRVVSEEDQGEGSAAEAPADANGAPE